ncbi:MAG: ABC transporter ATP-binding protein [Myxococcales bacterium]|nr:ABC transporter ATP-binding protein [Myxococcales bacterium]MDD9969163.1 ABC transporter ATP-binding protein [Myxococcales bacterium]
MSGSKDLTTPAPEQLPLLAVLRRGLPLLRPYRGKVAMAMGLICLWTGTNLAGPWMIKYAIDRGIQTDDSMALNLAIGAYVAIKLSAYVIHRAQILMLSQVGEGFLRDLRVRVFAHMQRLSMPFYDRHKVGVLVSRMTSDVDSLQELVQTGLMMLISSGLLLVLSTIVLTIASPVLMAMCLVAVPPVVWASVRFARRSRLVYTRVRDQVATTLSRLQEGIVGVRVIQAFAREQHEVQRFAEENDKLYDAHIEASKLQAFYLPVIEMAGVGTTALVVLAGGFLVARGTTTIGTVTFFILTLSNLFEPIQQFSQLFNQMQSAGAGMRKLFGLLDTPIDVPEHQSTTPLPKRGDIEVVDVSFRYGEQGDMILSGVALSIASGERLALVGPTGAGKSTLAKLIARMYDPSGGSIRFGGVDLRDAKTATLRQRIVVVPQEGFLFNTSILENVRIARGDASDDEVSEALARVGALERFQALPEGLQTMVDERGSRLSAGEKQLVSLARAALVDPAVLVLDEATSNLDPGTERLVEHAMAQLMGGRTVIVIAHRLSTAQQADRVAVVADGRLAELGSHDDLVEQGGHYAALFSSWRRAGGPEAARRAAPACS